jgi:hypothetical protein
LWWGDWLILSTVPEPAGERTYSCHRLAGTIRSSASPLTPQPYNPGSSPPKKVLEPHADVSLVRSSPRIRQRICSFARGRFMGIHPSAEMAAASGIGEDSGWGLGGGGQRPPSESAPANERTNSASRRDREAGRGGRSSRSQRLAPTAAVHQPTPKTCHRECTGMMQFTTCL